ncbi:MAG: ShlB/FhaC/HecB family hemolysin secretion/activation protein [Pseudomonadota bacterium]
MTYKAAMVIVAAMTLAPLAGLAQSPPRSADPASRLDAPELPLPGAERGPDLSAQVAPPTPAANPAIDLRLPLSDVILIPTDAPLAALPALQDVRPSLIGQVVDLTALEGLRRRMTEVLVSAGYISSGLVLREIDLDRGTATYALTEGRLVDVRASGDGMQAGETRTMGELAPGYVTARIPRPEGAFNVIGTEEALRVLLRDRNIDRIDAAIRPGTAPGDAILDMNVTARRPYDIALTLANDTPDSIGEETARLSLAARNVIASGDELRSEFEVTEGRRRIILDGDVPLWPGGPAPFLIGEYATSDFVRNPADAQDFRTSFLRFGAGVRVPLIDTSREQLTTIVAFDWKRTRSQVIGVDTSFSLGVEDGRSRTAVLSFAHEYVRLAENSTLALRGSVNFGLPVLNATQNGPGIPDGEFVSLIGQAQAAYRATPEVTIIARAQGQVATGALLPVEQVAIGGRETVRGFGEASVFGDNALVGSLEARIATLDLTVPQVTPPDHDATLILAPFIDAGAVRRLLDGTEDFLVGAGAGLIWSPHPAVTARAYYGIPIRGAENGSGLQGEGVHLAVSIALP